MVGNFLAPAIARRLREEQMLVGALGLSAVSGIIAAVLGGPAAGAFLAAMLNLAGAVGRLAFESIVQRDAPRPTGVAPSPSSRRTSSSPGPSPD